MRKKLTRRDLAIIGIAFGFDQVDEFEKFVIEQACKARTRELNRFSETAFNRSELGSSAVMT